MTNGRPRRRSIFSGAVLILLGLIFLAQNFRGEFGFWDLFWKWWPLLLIIWGLAKLVDRLAAQRSGEGSPPTITGGEILLVCCLIFLGLAVSFGHRFSREIGADVPWGNEYSFNQDLGPQAVPANSHISIHTLRGDIEVHAEDAAEIRVSAKKTGHAWSENEAQRECQRVSVAISHSGDGYEVGTQGSDTQRCTVSLEVHVPKQAEVSARTDHGDVHLAGLEGAASVNTARGDVEVRDAGGDVGVETRKGDIQISDAAGNVKISGRGGDLNISNVAGAANIDGEFFGSIRLEKISKGIHFLSQRTDLTVTKLSGRVDTSSGNLEITDASGSISLKTRDYDINMENIGGRIHIENRNGSVELRFANPPKDDIEIANERAGITVTLPAKSAFEIHADSHSGEIESEFTDSALKKTGGGDEDSDSHLEGKVGSRGPKINLKTSYGSIALRKAT
jgi:hypothetical protein